MNFNFHPGLFLIVSGILLPLLPQKLRRPLILIGPVLALGALQYWETDRLTFLFGFIFAIAGIISAIYSLHVQNKYELSAEAIYAGSAFGVVFAQDWISLIVYWEMMAVFSWLIIVSKKTRAASKAGFRYLLMHMFGGGMLLAGIVIKLLDGDYAVASLTGEYDLAFWCILIGVGVNAVIPPWNGWIADAYPNASIGGTVYLGSYTTKVAVFCLIKLFAGTKLLLYVGVGMALYGAAMALIENHMRKLFSYHIVSQLGYMVAALALGSEMGIDGSAAHAFQNILYKGTLFMCTGAVVYATGKEKISQLGGLRKDMPVTSLCFLIASLAIAGFPLLNGFVSKGLIMNSMAESGAALAELLLMIASIGTFLSITLKVNYFVFFGAAETITEADERKVPVNMKVAMVIGALACVFFGLFPQAIYHLVPYGTDGHAYTMDHITQSLELFAGAGLVFVMMIEHMKPKEKITLDTDWFYRKPMKALILGLSIGISMLFQKVGNMLGQAVTTISFFFYRPYEFMVKWGLLRKREIDKGMEDDDVLQRPTGFLVAINFFVFLFAAVVIFYLRYYS